MNGLVIGCGRREYNMRLWLAIARNGMGFRLIGPVNPSESKYW